MGEEVSSLMSPMSIQRAQARSGAVVESRTEALRRVIATLAVSAVTATGAYALVVRVLL
jgi:hypothetical protein